MSSFFRLYLSTIFPFSAFSFRLTASTDTARRWPTSKEYVGYYPLPD